MAAQKETPTYELTYFAGRGLAETSRLLFAAANQPYKDSRFPVKVIDWSTYTFERKEFDDAKAAGKLVRSLGKLPFLRTAEVVIPQSKAIERYLARQFNMFGETELESALVDAVCEHFRDIKAVYQPLRKLTGPDKKDKMEHFFKETLKERFIAIEKSLSNTEWLVGTTLTLADICLYDLVTFFDAQELVQAALANASRLQHIFEKVQDLPEIQTWLSTRPVTPF